MIFSVVYQSFPNDSGPWYQETVQGRFPVEPFNTYSNIFFLLIVFYFSWLVYRDYKKQQFLAYTIPVLFLGFIGGTVYHATRSHDFWMYLDWLPIIFLCLAVSIYFIARLKLNWINRILLVLLVLFFVFGIRMIPWDLKIRTSVGYLGTALGLILPVILYFFVNTSRNWQLFLYAFISFCVAITFRIMDGFVEVFPMGSHWLWHSFGALSVYFLMKYIYLDRLETTLNSENLKV